MTGIACGMRAASAAATDWRRVTIGTHVDGFGFEYAGFSDGTVTPPPAAMGSMNVNSYLGNSIYQIMFIVSGLATLDVKIAGVHAQSLFTRIEYQVSDGSFKGLDTSAAGYATTGTYTRWVWGSIPNNTLNAWKLADSGLIRAVKIL